MRKVSFLFFAFLLFSLFFIAGTVNAYDSAVVWNQPTGPTDPITLQTGFEWQYLASGVISGEGTGWSITVTDPRLTPGVVLLKLVWDTTVTTGVGGNITILGGTAYKRAVISQPGPQTFSGSVTWPQCSNGHFVDVPFRIYIDPQSPYNTTKNCPTGCVVQDGICIASATSSVAYSPALNCLASEGYVYQDGICIKSTTTVLADTLPTAISLTKLTDNYCTAGGGSGDLFFQWIYADADNDNQTMFDFQIDEDSNFSSPDVDRKYCDLNYSSPNTNAQAVDVLSSTSFSLRTYCDGQYITPVPTPDALQFNRQYYWRVKVYNAFGNSGWVSEAPFTTAQHAYPLASFSVSPGTFVNVGQVVTFTSTSVCYGATCIATWNFGDGHTATGNVVTHTYNALGTYQVTLSVADGTGYICNNTNSDPITVWAGGTGGSNTPQWREISPF